MPVMFKYRDKQQLLTRYTYIYIYIYIYTCICGFSRLCPPPGIPARAVYVYIHDIHVRATLVYAGLADYVQRPKYPHVLYMYA